MNGVDGVIIQIELYGLNGVVHLDDLVYAVGDEIFITHQIDLFTVASYLFLDVLREPIEDL